MARGNLGDHMGLGRVSRFSPSLTKIVMLIILDYDSYSPYSYFWSIEYLD